MHLPLKIASMCLALTGCASNASNMDARLTPYVGRSIADVILDHGPPTTSIDMGANKRGFQWQKNGATPGAVVPISSGALITVPSERQIACLISFTATTNKPTPAMSDWIVDGYRWNGRAC